jgi:hypothetical protein
MPRILLLSWLLALSSAATASDQKIPGAPAFLDKFGIEMWFKKYDMLTKKGDVEAMADMALFPINVVTTDAKGLGFAEQWDRAKFVTVMKQSIAGTPKDLEFQNKRENHFLGPDIVVVVTDATYSAGKQTWKTRYADVLVKDGAGWKFQTMAQAGWADMLKGKEP